MLILSLAAALLLTQEPSQPPALEGRVVDAFTERPVAGTLVIALRSQGRAWAVDSSLILTRPSTGLGDPKATQAAVLTGADGRFSFRFDGPGPFALFVDAAGYSRPLLDFGPENTFDPPKSDILLKLTPAAAVSGRVLDAETTQPAAGLLVKLERYEADSGHVLIFGDKVEAMPGFRAAPPRFDSENRMQFLKMVAWTNTGNNGQFSFDRIEPGDYLLEVRPRHAISYTRDVGSSGLSERKAYASLWYPGVGRLEDALPLHLAAGASMDNIEIRPVRTKLATLRGRILGRETGSVDASLSVLRVTKAFNKMQFDSLDRSVRNLDSHFEIADLSPGTYYLRAQGALRGSAGQTFASATVEIGEEDQEGLDLHLSMGVDISGTVVVDSAYKTGQPSSDADRTSVALNPIIVLGLDRDSAPQAARSQGATFGFRNVLPTRYHVVAFGPQGFEVSEVRYNGELQAGSIIEINAATGVHSLEIKLAPANASVLAAVTDGDQPAAKATLLLVPARLTEKLLRFVPNVVKQAVAGEDGRAEILGLLPGSYRVTAYPKGDLWADDPNLYLRLTAGDEVQVAAGQAATIAVRAQPAEGDR